MSENHHPVLCGQVLDKHRHVCAIFNSREEAREIMGEFIAEGCRRGQKNWSLNDPELAEDAVQHLRDQGIDVDGVTASGVCDLRTWNDTYLRKGHFCGEGMLELISRLTEDARQAGHKSVWAAGDMNWASQAPNDSLEVIKYEARLNELKDKFVDDVWVCYYDASLFNGRIISDIIRAHPAVLLGKRLFENPFYTSAKDLLHELKEWEAYKPIRPRVPVSLENN